MTPEPSAEKWLQTCVLHLGGGGAGGGAPRWPSHQDDQNPGPRARSLCAGPQPAPTHLLDFGPAFRQGNPLTDLLGQKLWQGRTWKPCRQEGPRQL